MPKKPSLTPMTLNVGRLLQERTRDYLKSLNKPGADVPDVLCIQDIPLAGLALFERLPHIAFSPMTNHLINGVRGVVGIAIASRYFLTDITHHTVWGDGKLKDLQGINDQNQRHLGAESDTLVEASEDRVAICAAVIKDGVRFDIATTHGMWVRGGVTNDAQRLCMTNLRGDLGYEGYRRAGLVLAADMNFGRGSEIYTLFTEKFRDCMPPEIDNTLDPEHPFVRKGGKVVTDYIMTHPAAYTDPYSISEVALHSGVSDHCALSCTVTKEG